MNLILKRSETQNQVVCKIGIAEFAHHFGVSVEAIPQQCRDFIAATDFTYTPVIGTRRDELILRILKRLEDDKQRIAAEGRTEVWQNGWAENLKEFRESGYDLKKLVPKFIRPNQEIRLNQDYVMPNNPHFEHDFFHAFRLWLFINYFSPYDSIYEFGCGTGFNLVELAKIYPKKNIVGSDFVQSSCDLVNQIADAYTLNIKGFLFDMIHPDETFEIKPNSAVYTFGSLEQLASQTESMLQFLLKKSPKLCVHMEPVVELYDPNNLVDHLAIRFHRKRGYTEGFLPRLQELESQGKIEILKIKRLGFGSLFMEGFSLIMWRPK